MKQFLQRWKFTSFVVFTITVLSTIPIPDNPPLGDVPLIDKWVHFVMYGGLVLSACLDRIVQKKEGNIIRFALVVCVLSSLYGGIIEVVQGLLGYRSCELLDFYADTIGAVLAAVIIVCLHLLFGRRPS